MPNFGYRQNVEDGEQQISLYLNSLQGDHITELTALTIIGRGYYAYCSSERHKLEAIGFCNPISVISID